MKTDPHLFLSRSAWTVRGEGAALMAPEAKGFTLFELLAATAISAMLLVGMMSVVASFSRPQADPTRKATAPPNRQHLQAAVHLLRRDLVAASQVQMSDGRVELLGYGALDRSTHEPTFRPARVTYSIQQRSGRRFLVRTQVELDELSNRNVSRQIVCADVVGIMLAPATAPMGLGGDFPVGGQFSAKDLPAFGSLRRNAAAPPTMANPLPPNLDGGFRNARGSYPGMPAAPLQSSEPFGGVARGSFGPLMTLGAPPSRGTQETDGDWVPQRYMLVLLPDTVGDQQDQIASSATAEGMQVLVIR